MDTYSLRSGLRNLEVFALKPDVDNEDAFILPKSLRDEIEQKLFELDKLNTLSHNYKEVLRDVLK